MKEQPLMFYIGWILAAAGAAYFILYAISLNVKMVGFPFEFMPVWFQIILAAVLLAVGIWEAALNMVLED